jgi:hypothetical protein
LKTGQRSKLPKESKAYLEAKKVSIPLKTGQRSKPSIEEVPFGELEDIGFNPLENGSTI